MTALIASFGSSKTGLTTVEYRELDADGVETVAATTTGVYEIGGGGYGVNIALSALDPTTVTIEWNTGEATPVYAHSSLEECINQAFIIKLLRNKRITDPSTGIQTIYDDDGVTPLVAGPVWEDAAGTTPYSATSEGVDRQDAIV